MDPKWFPPDNRPLQSGARSIVGAGLVGVTALLLPQGQFRKVIAIPPLLLILYNLRRYSTGKQEEDYLTAVNVAMTLAKVVDVCVLHNAENDLRRLKLDGSVRETAEQIRRMTWWQKFRWNLDLFTTMRGIGWNWSVKNVDQVSPDVSRSRFALEQLLRASYCFLFLDVLEWYSRWLSSTHGSDGLPDLFFVSLRRQVLAGWRCAFHNGFTMVFGYYLVAALAVGSGLYGPQAWPAMFGSFVKEGYTMRNIWGRCWHQNLRRMFETANATLVDLLGIRKGTITSRYLQLYNAFFLSAVIHHIGSLNCPYSDMVWYQFSFFMMQPLAITIEDFAVHLGRRGGLKDTWKTRTVGYMWVGCFLSYSLRYAAAGFVAAGLGNARHPLVAKFSIMDRVVG